MTKLRVLVYEPSPYGHRLDFVRNILEGLAPLGVETTLATTRTAIESNEWKLHLADLAIPFETTPLPWEPPRYMRSTRAAKSAHLLARCARSLAADHVLVPSGDGIAQLAGVLSTCGLLRSLRGIPCEVLLLRGGYGYAQGGGKQWRQRMWLRAIERGPFDRCFHLDPFQAASLRREFGAGARWGAMPDPVQPPPPLERGACRIALGLPPSGRYLACAGRIDAEKGIDRLLESFTSSLPRLAREDRLLLAGPFDPRFRESFLKRWSKGVTEGRVHILDRHLTRLELDQVMVAADFVAAPYRRAWQSSGIALRAMAARRPVLVHNDGWFREMIRRFEIGWGVATDRPAEFQAAIEQAFHEAAEFDMGKRLDPLIEYHAPANFRAHWTSGLRERLGLPPDPFARTYPEATSRAPGKRIKREQSR